MRIARTIGPRVQYYRAALHCGTWSNSKACPRDRTHVTHTAKSNRIAVQTVPGKRCFAIDFGTWRRGSVELKEGLKACGGVVQFLVVAYPLSVPDIA
eukprot:871344-Rhodomonas_salina.2